MSFMMYAPTLVLFGNKQLDNLHKQMRPGKKALKGYGKGRCFKAEYFIDMLEKLQQECWVNDLKMSDYGIMPDEFHKMTKNACETMPSQFLCDRKSLTDGGHNFNISKIL